MTSIEWTDKTWNPIVGCSIVSPGCTNCYAMKQASRLNRMTKDQPTHYFGTTKIVNSNPVWTGKLALAPDHILTAPLRWKKPRKIFVNSMGDLFHEDVPDAWIDRVFAVMASAPHHTFQVLTKRSARMRDYLTCRNWIDRIRHGDFQEMIWECPQWLTKLNLSLRNECRNPVLPNVWLGISAEDQTRADERIPDLLATPAAVRFVSAEPLLGPIDFNRIGNRKALASSMPSLVRRIECGPPALVSTGMQVDALGTSKQATIYYQTADHMGGFMIQSPRPFSRLDWIIVGGESGPGARPMHPDWARAIRDQCAQAGVAFFFKQWGAWAPLDQLPRDTKVTRRPALLTRDGKLQTGRVAFTLEGDGATPIARLDKRRTGRALDGATHDAWPEARG